MVIEIWENSTHISITFAEIESIYYIGIDVHGIYTYSIFYIFKQGEL